MFLAHLQEYTDGSSSARRSQGGNFSSEFERLVHQKSRDGLVFCGVEKLVELRIFDRRSQSETIPSSVSFYCSICKSRCRSDDVIRHISSYLHIFRYMKRYYPIEYRRILCENASNDPLEYAVSHITIMIRFLDERNAFPLQEPLKKDLHLGREESTEQRIQNELRYLNRNQSTVPIPLDELPHLESRLDRRYMNVQRGELPEQVRPDFEELHIESNQSSESASPESNFMERLVQMDDDSEIGGFNMADKRRFESSNSISSLCHESKRPRKQQDTTPPITSEELDPNIQNYLRMMIQHVIEGTQPFTQELMDTITQHMEWIDTLVDSEETSVRLVELVDEFRSQKTGYHGDHSLEGEHFNYEQSDEETQEDNDDVFN